MEAAATTVIIDSEEGLELARQIRHVVFVEEQGIPPEIDDDGADREATHLLTFVGAQAVATGRLVVGAGHVAVLSRIAVLPGQRGRGFGRDIIRSLEEIARSRGASRLELHPHHYLEAFYESLGYRAVEGTSVVGSHRLITMIRILTSDR